MLYTVKIVRRVIERYSDINPNNLLLQGFEDIVCILQDVNKAINESLSPKEHQVINVIKEFGVEKSSSIVGISCHTVKFHLNNASLKISNHLNRGV